MIVTRSVALSNNSFGKSVGTGAHIKGTVRRLCSFSFYIVSGLMLLLIVPENSLGYYVGPEVGKAPGETRSVKTRVFGYTNATSLAEAAYVPYVYSVGNNVVTFLRSIIPALQPKVDFFAEQIQDGIDTANTKLMQTLENSNNGIIAAENFFHGLFKAVVLGKGPDDDDEERRRRLATALIKSGMLNSISTSSISTTTKRPAMMITTTGAGTTKRSTSTSSSTSSTSTTTTTATTTSTQASRDDISTNPPPSQKARDNIFNKMKDM